MKVECSRARRFFARLALVSLLVVCTFMPLLKPHAQLVINEIIANNCGSGSRSNNSDSRSPGWMSRTTSPRQRSSRATCAARAGPALLSRRTKLDSIDPCIKVARWLLGPTAGLGVVERKTAAIRAACI